KNCKDEKTVGILVNSNILKILIAFVVKMDQNFLNIQNPGRTVYAIPHYSYYKAYSYENGAKMGKSLSSDSNL
ncbi:MAG: hypothetical protein LBD76_08120, partial [Prevotellaceae bacterium]|nr:hypothetical protein [Prevotellaceae bacterium]